MYVDQEALWGKQKEERRGREQIKEDESAIRTRHPDGSGKQNTQTEYTQSVELWE